MSTYQKRYCPLPPRRKRRGGFPYYGMPSGSSGYCFGKQIGSALWLSGKFYFCSVHTVIVVYYDRIPIFFFSVCYGDTGFTVEDRGRFLVFDAGSMFFRSLICFVTVCGNMYGSTEGSTGRAKPGKPCAVRGFSRNNPSNTVSKAPVALRSSPRDTLQNVFFTARLAWAVFFFDDNQNKNQ